MRVLITGTSNGIGTAIAIKFIEAKMEVIGIDREPIPEELKESERLGLYTHIHQDIRNAHYLPRIDNVNILINNAGTQNEDDINTNLRGTMNVTEKYAFHEGIKSVLMIGSASAHTGAEFPEYVASKGGVIAYTKNVALRLAKYKGTCNSLDFGGVSTSLNSPVMEDPKLWDQIMDLTPLRKWMSPLEAAEWVYFMTVVNSFCSGQNILIDGLEAGNSKFIWPEDSTLSSLDEDKIKNNVKKN